MVFIRNSFRPAPSPTLSSHSSNASVSPVMSPNLIDVSLDKRTIPTDINNFTYNQESDNEVAERLQHVSSSPLRYQPFSSTVWRPYGPGMDLPWSLEENAWDKLIPLHAPMGTVTEWPFTLWLVEPKPTRREALKDALEQFETVRLSLNEEKAKH